MNRYLKIVVLMACMLTGHAKVMVWDIINYPENVESVVISGNVNILMDGKSSRNIVKYKPKYVQVTIKDKVMTISSTAEGSADVSIRLFAAKGLENVQKMTINDNVNLTARGLIGPHEIEINTSGRVMLEGYLSAPKITQNGDANTEVLWLSGTSAAITLNSGYMKIAGNLKKSYVSLANAAHLDAKHLRIDNLWLSTKDQADVSVYPSKELHVTSLDESTVRSVYKPSTTSQYSDSTATVVFQSIFSS